MLRKEQSVFGDTGAISLFHFFFKSAFHYTFAEVILISVRSLQRSEGDVSDPISIYIVDQHD